MKKFIALFTMFVLLVGIFQVPGAAFAEEKTEITLKQAIEIAKKTLDLKTEGFEFNSSYIENQNGFNSWSLSWYDNKVKNENFMVSVDSQSGEIVAVSWYTPYEQPKTRIPKFSKAQAQSKAEEWAAKLQGARFKQTKLNSSPDQDYYNKYSDVYSFQFVRVQEGVDVTSNTITVQLDKNTLALKNFTIVWDKQSLTSKAKAFSLDKAKENFKKLIGLELTYNLIYKEDSKSPEVVLAYTLKNNNTPIDAVTGEILNGNIYRHYMDKGAANAKTESAPMTPQEQSELEKNSKYISKADAEEVVKQYIKIDDSMKLVRANLYAGYNGTNGSWNMEWNSADAKEDVVKYINVQVDAVSKELNSYYVYYSDEKIDKTKVAVTKEQAKKLAEDYLTKVQPDKFKNSQYREYKDSYGYAPTGANNYSFSYVRVENGIPCPSNTLSVTINQYTGEIISFGSNWTNISLPALGNIIFLDKAYEILFEKVKFNLQHVYHFKNMNDYENKELRLAYVLDNTNIQIDGKTGQMLNYDGTPVKSEDPIVYTDIKGNKAEEEINILIEMGILEPETDKFAPDSKILQKDFIMLLMNSIQPQYYPQPIAKTEAEYNNYYKEAIRLKIITEKDKKPTAVVTRQDAAKMIVRAMGYGVLAEKSNMFAINFKDAAKLTPAYKGYAVIAAQFGIITPVSSNFNPTTVLTKGDVVEAIVNYLRCETSL